MLVKTFHYTSWSNWQKIQVFGMKPYPITNKEELNDYFPGGVNGIWMWKTKPVGRSHAGCIIFQMGQRNEDKVVQLELTVDNQDFLKFGERNVAVFHHGNINGFEYHSNEEARILTQSIPPRDIKLLKVFDITKRLQ